MDFNGPMARKEIQKMGRFKKDDIRGYFVEGQWVCLKCIEADEREDIDQDDILTQQAIETADDLIFCDRCKHEII